MACPPCKHALTQAKTALVCLAFGCVENLVMMEHVEVYSFDSFKALVVLGLWIGLLSARLASARCEKAAMGAFVLALALSSLWSGSIYDAPRRPQDSLARTLAEEIRRTAPSDALPMVVPSLPYGTTSWLGESPLPAPTRERALIAARSRGAVKVALYVLSSKNTPDGVVLTGIESYELIPLPSN